MKISLALCVFALVGIAGVADAQNIRVLNSKFIEIDDGLSANFFKLTVFGVVPAGANRTRTFVVQNTDVATTLTVSSISFSDPVNFTVLNGADGLRLPRTRGSSLLCGLIQLPTAITPPPSP